MDRNRNGVDDKPSDSISESKSFGEDVRFRALLGRLKRKYNIPAKFRIASDRQDSATYLVFIQTPATCRDYLLRDCGHNVRALFRAWVRMSDATRCPHQRGKFLF